jgi:hypothetical protein
MKEIVVIEKTKLQRVFYQGRPVVTLAMIARVHQVPYHNVMQSFNRNRNRFIEGVDYVVLPHEEWSSLVVTNSDYQSEEKITSKGGHRGESYLFFESGYLMLVKPMTDDRSWDVQRSLVNHYFSSEKAIALYKGTITLLQEKLIESLDDANTYKRLYIDKIEQGPRQPMTDQERRQIIDLKSQGRITSEIVKKTGWSGSTVNKIVRKAREAGELPPMPWSEKLKLIHLHPEFFKEVR